MALALSIGRKRVNRRQRKAAVAAASAGSAAILCFDIGSFDAVQTDGEVHALSRQIVQSYGFNRSATCPFRFALAGFATASRITEALETHSSHNWLVRREELAPWDAFPASCGWRLLYLSADADAVLDADAVQNCKSVLIIGGLVDQAGGHAGGARVGEAHRVAEKQSIQTARLPIDDYVVVRKPSLTCLAVVQILAGVAATGCWKRAVQEAPAMRCAPLKKYVRWKDDDI